MRKTFLAILGAAAFIASAQASDRETTLATRGGQAVSLGDVDAFVSKIPAHLRHGYIDNPERIETTVGNILLQRQLAAQARAKGLEQDPDVLTRIRHATEEVLARVYLDRLSAAENLPDFDALAQEHYATRKAEYVIPERINATHLLIKSDTRSADEARAIAEDLLAKVKSGDLDFDQAVREHSEEPGAGQHGGKLVNAVASKLDPGFVAVAFSLRTPGEIGPLAESRYGFHLIRLDEYVAPRQMSFDEARPQILKTLSADFVKTMRQRAIQDAQAEPMDVNEQALEALRTRYLPSSNP